MNEHQGIEGIKPSELLKGRPVAVIGAGLVGAGWAIVFAQAGLDVRIYDVNPQATEWALSLIAEQLKELQVLRFDRRCGCDRGAPQTGIPTG